MSEPTPTEPARLVRERAPWLLAEELGTCVVGSTALAEACRRAGVSGPDCADLDLAWAPAVDEGLALLQRHGVLLPTTEPNRARGTLALRLGKRRVEITSFRKGDGSRSLDDRILADLGARDMTVGALAWHLQSDRVFDPFGGVDHWRDGRIVPVGDPHERVTEHPVRFLRYYRRAHRFGFALDPSIRKLRPDPEVLARIPSEAVAAELRAALCELASPGRFLIELDEVSGLAPLAPELASQFDGRPAGPARFHPEVGQALHVILALEWAAGRTAHLGEPDRAAVLLAVLCHDLGKGLTPPGEFPSHLGHEAAGIAPIRRLFERLPGLGDAGARRLCEQVCALHLLARNLRRLKPGTLARLYDEHFRSADFRVELFALAVGADSGGRLGMAGDGDRLAGTVQADVEWLRACCGTVDAKALREQHPGVDEFRGALHETRARAIRAGSRPDPFASPPDER